MEAKRRLEDEMRNNPETVIHVRKILLGQDPTPEKIEEIGLILRKDGYILPESVT